MGCHFLLQGIFLTQGSNPGLLHCRQIRYQLSHQGRPNAKLGAIQLNWMRRTRRTRGRRDQSREQAEGGRGRPVILESAPHVGAFYLWVTASNPARPGLIGNHYSSVSGCLTVRKRVSVSRQQPSVHLTLGAQRPRTLWRWRSPATAAGISALSAWEA